MFVLTTEADTVRIQPDQFAQPTLECVHNEIDENLPNRVIMDVGLVICRYGDVMRVGDGLIVAGDGCAHHEVVFRLVVFRPFVEEVCIGSIVQSNEDGIRISMQFFDDIFVPAYWMLRPSQYDSKTGLWVWTPNYDEDEEAVQGGEAAAVKTEEGVVKEEGEGEKEPSDEYRFEMEIGSEIRFKVKAIHFTRVTNTAKGVQATTTTTAQSAPQSDRARALSTGSADGEQPVRKRSSSFDLSDSQKFPASMQIVASICEDGLGLTSWWASQNEEEELEEE